MNEIKNNFENLIVGALMYEPQEIIKIVDILPDGSYFDNQLNGITYDAVLGLQADGCVSDMHVVIYEVVKRSKITYREIANHLASLSGLVCHAGNIVYHAVIVKEQWMYDQARLNADKLHGLANNSSVDLEDLIGEMSNMTQSAISHIQPKGLSTMAECMEQVLTSMEVSAKQMATGSTIGITTGLRKLDRVTGGWQPGQLVILAGRPAMGKSALMLHFAKSAAKSKKSTVIFSLEMSALSLSKRLTLAEMDGVDSDNFRRATLTPEEWTMMEKAAVSIRNMPIHIDEKADATMQYIESTSTRLKAKGQCDMIVIDYLQLISSPKTNNRNREQEVAQISRQAKILAKKLGVPVIMLSQLSRSCETRPDKKPLLSDLRESGAIEQDADVVMFVYRPAYYGQIEYNHMDITLPSKDMGVLIVAKQRDGATGNVLFKHNDSLTKITNYERY